MRVGSQLEEAQLEQIASADEATASKASGRVYSNYETGEILVGDGTKFIRFRKGEGVIGDVKASMLNETQFQLELDDTWIIADGRDVTGSDFHALTGFSIVPDLRGQFIRGTNDGGSASGARSDGKENPETKLVGLQQDGAVGPHQHTYTVGVATAPNLTGSLGGDAANVTTYASSNPISPNGVETRPTNVSLNLFIKINRLP